MTKKTFFFAFLRQTTYAASLLTAFGLIAERLIPSSVLPHLPLFWIASATMALILVIPPRHS